VKPEHNKRANFQLNPSLVIPVDEQRIPHPTSLAAHPPFQLSPEQTNSWLVVPVDDVQRRPMLIRPRRPAGLSSSSHFFIQLSLFHFPRVQVIIPTLRSSRKRSTSPHRLPVARSSRSFPGAHCPAAPATFLLRDRTPNCGNPHFP
jgi:hypothetical protein